MNKENAANSKNIRNSVEQKKLIVVNGTMGVGKTATCRLLNKKLNNSVWLDGDWCWQINPFVVNEENKKMVEDNIQHLLRSYLSNSTLEYVIFNWVIHREDIMDMVLNMVKDFDFQLFRITLTCSEEALIKRISKDVEEGLRKEEQIEWSLEKLPMYGEQQTIKIDTSDIGVDETVERVLEILEGI
ncbi:AAA family ATPase [Alkaliphilus hydrothermalis]|uniref:Broad-specificity NMP kinase n=1 Tax=Alkaliphilus hydrothermalis TaxID=1482730 RepID=A0ABS2NT03_9FIRM|nr:AAA family ATPase [Alkaliphilus hydrothermalis]MBM7616088.1 broad-specificity NMP kinase [Alkaliphilus hydrothermalis]